MIKKVAYGQSFLGMTKKEVLKELGDSFNFYPDDIWQYELNKTWWGLKTIMFLEFENNIVSSKYTKNVFGSINVGKRE
ncbi:MULTISPECIES: hypothetical protein [unclassified Chryseobacterium]|jgi:hypothetical protein|uniref:hypothetical protein n=1 Tax=unclassified Chryseobacterium TaxID=2593645 RepID=UPI00300FBBDE